MTRLPLVAVGASTGGTRALEALLRDLPDGLPPIVVVQHTLPSFVSPFVRRLDSICQMEVVEAEDGLILEWGQACIATGGAHLRVERLGDRLCVRLDPSPPVQYHRPSVDVLFHSIATITGVDAVAVILTGMGRDGAEGMLALRQSGAHTLAQDQHSSVIFGMAKEAIALGAAEAVASLDQIPDLILRALESPTRRRPLQAPAPPPNQTAAPADAPSGRGPAMPVRHPATLRSRSR